MPLKIEEENWKFTKHIIELSNKAQNELRVEWRDNRDAFTLTTEYSRVFIHNTHIDNLIEALELIKTKFKK